MPIDLNTEIKLATSYLRVQLNRTEESIPLALAVVDQVVDHLVGAGLLLLAALGAIGQQGVGQDALQLVTVRGAAALVHQALEVVVEQAVRLQDLVQIDTIVLGGVLLLGGNGSNQGQGNDDEELHLYRNGLLQAQSQEIDQESTTHKS
uniref:Uncharacterized protein n=1 Tax=Anopheles atroparvus TaxID=41427 RepID=A0A182IJ37_ANOAO